MILATGFYLVGLFLSPILSNFDSLGLKMVNVTGEKRHLAAAQLSWKETPVEGRSRDAGSPNHV